MRKKTAPGRKMRKPSKKPLTSSHGGKAPKSSRASVSRAGKPTLWDQASRWYDSLVGMSGSDYHRTILMPGVLRMLELKAGRCVLDLACGQGVLSRYLLQKKLKPEGLDSSEQLLRMARSRSEKSIPYHLGNAGDTAILEGKKFDGVACILAVQNMENIESVLKNVARWLKPSGKFVMVLTHPCFRIPRQSNWGWDGDKKTGYRRIDRYANEMEIPILTPPFVDKDNFTMTYHRPLQSYFSALLKAGLCVDSMEEWVSDKESEPGKRSRGENRARKEIPLFMAIRAVQSASKNKE
ncbi:MAG: class I SAM-dependent methyltransferase [Nitrospinaceae bacterium]|nr:class I SAM-dependent methyltransferase [Nitrospinaceae bacterium]MDP6711121.1 class I SAM-dependent methyltransferase [Nitrospinaceae bacterium]